MNTKAAVPVEEYLHTSYPDLDREYRAGEVVERSLPDYLHSKTQGLLAAIFVALRKTLHLFPCTELRLQLEPGKFLISDICVFHPTEPTEDVPSQPPFIVIEILSPDDRMSEVRAKLEEYRTWGVPHVWLADPHSKRLYACDGALVELPVLRVPELHLEVGPTDIFE